VEWIPVADAAELVRRGDVHDGFGVGGRAVGPRPRRGRRLTRWRPTPHLCRARLSQRGRRDTNGLSQSVRRRTSLDEREELGQGVDDGVGIGPLARLHGVGRRTDRIPAPRAPAMSSKRRVWPTKTQAAGSATPSPTCTSPKAARVGLGEGHLAGV